MTGFNAGAEMGSVAAGLEQGLHALDGLGAPPFAQAGQSIVDVAKAVGQLAQASAGISGGLHQEAGQIRAARETYVRADHVAGENMPGSH